MAKATVFSAPRKHGKDRFTVRKIRHKDTSPITNLCILDEMTSTLIISIRENPDVAEQLELAAQQLNRLEWYRQREREVA